ncbi:M14 family zinc carboxypeptidase [Bdellovibrio bacteriovorus]|uniref:Zinc carboxypeptidase n=1 Tax=Bdellovibrio bacteriovorus TaxID=959 RepID=A0A150WD87_BDEBC|nr:M14 family zinc carboxypeptidase [Bdellovibrio bacteriovorus]KYG60923.1 zinc carboxypeptidase [Bdellovibrio bacteriovorus]
MTTLPEIQQIEKRIRDLGTTVKSEVLAYSEDKALRFPIYKITFGSEDPQAPVLGFVGGVHGLERIGAQVCVALMNSLAELTVWDQTLQSTLKNIRVFFIPTVNPIGIYRKTRSNPRGVDLMRNAPVDGDQPARWVGGHRVSSRLPWYRGVEGAPMEVEAQAMVKAVQDEIRHSPLALTLDLHSGFGFQDRLWFPYAKTVKPFPDLPMTYSLKNLLDRTYPHHFYRVEPQAQSYTTHGDLWDYIYDEHLKTADRQQKYLPLCLEMGSWMWVKKNPWQIFRSDGPFNPLKGHRHRRTLRRHNTLMEFLIRAVASPQAWANMNGEQEKEWALKAQELWYGTK